MLMSVKQKPMTVLLANSASTLSPHSVADLVRLATLLREIHVLVTTMYFIIGGAK